MQELFHWYFSYTMSLNGSNSRVQLNSILNWATQSHFGLNFKNNSYNYGTAIVLNLKRGKMDLLCQLVPSTEEISMITDQQQQRQDIFAYFWNEALSWFCISFSLSNYYQLVLKKKKARSTVQKTFENWLRLCGSKIDSSKCYIKKSA